MNVSETHFVAADDGVHLHIRIKGKMGDRTPVLYLHGGPGSGLNLAAFETCAGPLLETCSPVDYLHQRDVFRSQGTGKMRQSLSLHIQDIRAAVTFLCRRFQQHQVYLLAHLWGGFIGCAYLSPYASTVAAFAAICPVVSFPHIQKGLDALVADKVSSGADPSANRELASIGKPLIC